MKIKAALAILILTLSGAGSALAQDVYVRGYTRSDGTYVRPHVRSAPNNTRADNYGPSNSGRSSGTFGGSSVYTPPSTRDHDRDGVANRYDRDDDSDTRHDDRDNSQYGRVQRSNGW